MPRYLISFDDGSMDHIPAGAWQAVGEASHAVVRDAKAAGSSITDPPAEAGPAPRTSPGSSTLRRHVGSSPTPYPTRCSRSPATPDIGGASTSSKDGSTTPSPEPRLFRSGHSRFAPKDRATLPAWYRPHTPQLSFSSTQDSRRVRSRQSTCYRSRTWSRRACISDASHQVRCICHFRRARCALRRRARRFGA